MPRLGLEARQKEAKAKGKPFGSPFNLRYLQKNLSSERRNPQIWGYSPWKRALRTPQAARAVVWRDFAVSQYRFGYRDHQKLIDAALACPCPSDGTGGHFVSLPELSPGSGCHQVSKPQIVRPVRQLSLRSALCNKGRRHRAERIHAA